MVIVHVFVLVLALLSFVSVACISPVNCINKLINFSQHQEYCTVLFCTVLYCTVLWNAGRWWIVFCQRLHKMNIREEVVGVL